MAKMEMLLMPALVLKTGMKSADSEVSHIFISNNMVFSDYQSAAIFDE